MRKSLLGMYHDLKESGSSSDYPYLLGNTMYKKLLSRFNGFPSPWKQYVMISNLADFKSNDRVIMSEAPDLDLIEADSGYKEAKFSDAKYSIQLETRGKTFTVDRRTIINDDLNGLTTVPDKFGRAAVRTLVKGILGLLNNASLAYDGKTLFNLRTATTRNYIANTALANTAAGMTAVATCMSRIRSQVDPDTGELMGLTPKYLITGTTLAPVAQQLVRSAQILPVSTNGGGTYNAIGSLIPIEEPLLDSVVSSTFWAVLADPADCPLIEVGFLDGKEAPDMLYSGASMFNVTGGGSDPYGYEFDDIKYKIRHDWAAKIAYYQAICRGYS